jgi:phage terminase large subunit-like protein
MPKASLPLLRSGSREPTHLTRPDGPLDYSVADHVLRWVDAVGLSLFPWQRDVLRDGLARQGSRWAAYECSMVLPRQNGKNEILAVLELASIACLGKRLIVHSAHKFATAQKHFQHMEELCRDLPELRKLMPANLDRGFVTSNGKEAIKFRNGARIEFKARSRGSARGFSADLIVLDEAFDLSPAAVGAMFYTLRARPDPQVWFSSSAAHYDSTVLHSHRRRHETGDSPRFLYAEWSNDANCDLSDPDTWYRVNPSLGLPTADGRPLIEEETVVNEWEAARHDPDMVREFAREVCGVPEGMAGDTGKIRVADWDALEDAESAVVGQAVFALDISPERSWSSIAAAGRRADGLGHVEVFERRQGTGWVADFVTQVWEAQRQPFRVDPASPAGALIPELRSRGVDVIEVSVREHAQGCGAIMDAVTNETLRHRVDPALRAAVVGARDRQMGDAWLWSRIHSSIDISPLVAVTLAWIGLPEKGATVAKAHIAMA